MVPRPRRSVACDLHKTLQQNMQRLTRRASSLVIFREKPLVALVQLYRRLLDKRL